MGEFPTSSPIAGPLYLQIREAIRRSIEAGELKPHDRVGSEHELAEKYGVSRVTARQALHDLEQEGAIYRIQGKGSFVAEPQTAFARPDEVPTIGVLVPYILDSFTMRMVEGIEKRARELGFRTTIANSDNKIDQEAELIAQIRTQSASGMIIWPADAPVYNEAILRLKLDGFPFVLVDRYMEYVPTDYVISDNVSGGFLATNHLLELGHRKIGFVSARLQPTLPNRLRYQGFQSALKERGIGFDPDLLHEVDSTQDDYMAQLCAFLQGRRPTAVFASNDIVAMMVLKAAFEVGIACPEQLSVVGFDNLTTVAHLQVPLTSIDQHVERIGRKAAEIVVAKIRGEADEPVQAVIPTELVIRESTRPNQASRLT